MNKDIESAERVLRGMLKEEFSPHTMLAALYNVLACGKGHKHAGVVINKSDDNDFEVMMNTLEIARTHAGNIEGK